MVWYSIAYYIMLYHIIPIYIYIYYDHTTCIRSGRSVPQARDPLVLHGA